MQHKVIKAATTITDQGRFTAIAAAYSVDRGNEQIDRGAFEKTIGRWQASGKQIPLHWDHSASPEDIIGAVDPADMRESDEGLYIKGQLDLENSEVAREAWRLMKNNVVGLSFGYLVNEDYDDDGVKHLKAVDLFELTITPAPMNPDTRFLDLKSHGSDTTLEQAEESPGEEAIEEAAAEEPAERLAKAAAQDPLRKAYDDLALDLTTRGITLAEPPKVEEKSPEDLPSMAELRRQHYDLMLNILTEGKQ